jgi:hypothetical protein
LDKKKVKIRLDGFPICSSIHNFIETGADALEYIQRLEQELKTTEEILAFYQEKYFELKNENDSSRV